RAQDRGAVDQEGNGAGYRVVGRGGNRSDRRAQGDGPAERDRCRRTDRQGDGCLRRVGRGRAGIDGAAPATKEATLVGGQRGGGRVVAGVDDRAAEQGLAAEGGAAVVLGRAEFRVEGGNRGADLVAVDPIDQADEAGVNADEVVDAA